MCLVLLRTIPTHATFIAVDQKHETRSKAAQHQTNSRAFTPFHAQTQRFARTSN